MNKWIFVAALATLGAAGGAVAQDCGTANTPQCGQVRPYWAAPQLFNPYGVGAEECGTANTPQCERGRPNWAGTPYYDPFYGPQVIATPYPPTRRDRDGDGVRNSRDRYPDDPRYR